MKNFWNRTVFFIGWILSPFTFWNDAFVNIPISYLCASLAAKVFRVDFLIAVLVFYWISNIAGIGLIYVSGRSIAEKGRGSRREWLILFITIVVYSLALVFLYIAGILKPHL